MVPRRNLEIRVGELDACFLELLYPIKSKISENEVQWPDSVMSAAGR